MDAAFAPLLLERLAELREEIARGDEPSSPHVVDYEAKRRKLTQKRERYLEQHSEGLITTDALRASLAKVDGELLKVAAEEAKRPRKLSTADRRIILRELATVESAWKKVSAPRRRELVRLLVERVEIASGQAPVPHWRSKEALSKGFSQ